MKKILTSLAFALLLTSVSFAQENKDYEAALNEMMVLSGTEQSYQMAIKQMMTAFKQQKSNVPDDVWSGLEAEFLKTSLADLVDMLVPVYQKHLSLEDIKGLCAFYNTPLGKKFAKQTPMILQESMQVGQQWGMKIGKEFTKKMQEKGY